MVLCEVLYINEIILYDLEMRNELYARNAKTVKFGSETITSLLPKMWTLVTQNIKNSSSFTCFGNTIKKWKPSYVCRLCKTFCNMSVLYSSTVVLSSLF